MNHPSSVEYDGRPRRQTPEAIHQDDRELLDTVLNMPISKDRIVTRAPAEPFRLTFVDVTCLVVNRTIGTGIFTGPRKVMEGVRSPGIAILMWVMGVIYGLSGAHVFVEYGLNVPRYVVNGVEQSVPRSGGELHYLQYVFSWPRYRKGTVLLSGVLFGISFICIGNMASNCIDCALRLLEAAHPGKSEEDFGSGAIHGIAIVIATVTCFIHAFSRRGGILLNNALAVIKVCFLVFIIIATWVVAGGWSGIHDLQGESSSEQICPPGTRSDPSGQTCTPATRNDPSGYTQAFLTVVFAFFGFDQPSYVLGEIKHPRKNLPRSMWWGMGIVSVLYVAVNVCFMIIVPAYVQLENDVPPEFFNRIFHSSLHAKRTVNAFMAISSFGNIVVWTYTAARMKQEIAKQCFIPFASFFAKNKDFSLGRLLMWLEGGSRNSRGRRIKFLNPANHREKTPVGALLLHLISCIILILATYSVSASDGYTVLIETFSYILAAWFGTFLAVGILILHFRGPPATQPVRTPNHNHVPDQEPIQRTWNQMIEGTVNPKLGVFCAGLYLVGSLYPVIMSWVPPKRPVGWECQYMSLYHVFESSSHHYESMPLFIRSSFAPFMWYKPCDSVAWYVVPLISWCILAFSALWFLGFVSIAKYRSHIGRKKFTYMCEPEFDWAEKSQQNLAGDDDLPAGETPGTRRGGLILIHETIYKTWQAMETSDLHSHAADNMDGSIIPAQGGLHQEHRHGLSGAEELANTDFTAFGRNEASGDEMELRVSRDTQYATLRGQQNRSERV